MDWLSFGYGLILALIVSGTFLLGEVSKSRTIIAFMTSEIMSLRYDVNHLREELAGMELVEPLGEEQWEVDEE